MGNVRFKPQIDRLFWFIWIPTVILLAVGTVISCASTIALLILLATDIFTLYFLISPLFGYVELRESGIFIRFGFFMTREISYDRVRGVVKARKFYSDSMVSLKNSMEHVNIKYDRFDMVSVSVVDNDGLMRQIEERISKRKL